MNPPSTSPPYVPALYINDAQTATIAPSPGRASDAKQRHSNASRHGEKTLPHWRSQPSRGPQTFRSALLGNRVSHAPAGQKLSGHRLYRQDDVDMVFRIKRLLYDEGFTI